VIAGATIPARRPDPATGDLTSEQRFRRDIQGLRAVAVALVVADHVFGWPAGGFVGVDVFFVISGFLITGLLVRERGRTGRLSFRAFYARRARRLLPAALVTLAATTAAAWFVFLEGRFQETVEDVVWAALFGANINFAREETDYFAATEPASMVQHFWSLSVEEQFYLFWPAMILLAFAVPVAGGRHHAGAPGRAHRRTVALWVVLGAITAASFAWSLHATGTSPVTAYFSTFTRAWELGVGALLAVSAAQLDRLPAPLRVALAWIGLAVVLASSFVVDDATPFPGSAAALPVLGAALVLAWGAAPGGPGTRWALSSAPAGFLGAISYSLYLWHWPVLLTAGALLTPASTLYYATVVGASLALATVSYYCVEQPVLHTNWLLPHKTVDRTRARPVFRRALAVGLGAAVVATATVVAVVIAPWSEEGDARAEAAQAVSAANQDAVEEGRPPLTPLQEEIQRATFVTEWPADLTPRLEDMASYGTDVWPGKCLLVNEDGLDDCMFGDPDAPQAAVLLGDSYATAWAPAFQQELVPAGWSVVALTDGDCPNVTALTILRGQLNTRCAEHRDWAIDYIVRTRPQLVVLSNTWSQEFQDPSVDRATVYGQGLTDVVRRLQPSGAKIVILSAPPGSADLRSCPTGLNGPADCVGSPVGTFATQVATEQRVAAETGVRAIDPEPWFCVDGRCPSIVGSTAVYFDGGHITAEWARRIAPQVVGAALQP
jgi:peptidoglycan/LPS O-acetylase OafA/YrhL